MAENRGRLPQEKVKQILDLGRQGKNSREISEITKSPVSTVYSVLTRHGLTGAKYNDPKSHLPIVKPKKIRSQSVITQVDLSEIHPLNESQDRSPNGNLLSPLRFMVEGDPVALGVFLKSLVVGH